MNDGTITVNLDELDSPETISVPIDKLEAAPKPTPFVQPQLPGGALSTRAAKIGRSGIPLTPAPMDTSKFPLNVFSGNLQEPGMPTEEELARNGTIGPRETTIGERVERAIGAGAPEGSFAANITGQRGTRQEPRLISPEQLMTESEQSESPILTGAGEFAGGLTTPSSAMLIAGTGGAGELAGPAGQTVKRLLAAGFTAQMLNDAARTAPEVADAIRRGDTYNAKRLMTHMVLGAGMAGLAAHGTFEEGAPLELEPGTVGGPLAMDQLGANASRRFTDFTANANARGGMADLANAERGVEQAKQDRINAPVQVPKIPETTAPPPILPGPPAGPEANPLSTEAAKVREEQGNRAASAPRESQPPQVIDRRRVGAGEDLAPESPATLRKQTDALAAGTNKIVYFPKGTESLPAPPENAQVTVVPGDKPGAGTYYHTADLTPEQIKSSVEDGTYGNLLGHVQTKNEASSNSAPTTVVARDESGSEIKASAVDSTNPQAIAEQAAELARQFPDAKITVAHPNEVVSARESTAPTRSDFVRTKDVADKYAGEARSLAGELADRDPELAGHLYDLANGRRIRFSDLREYAQEHVEGGKQKAAFIKAVDDAEAEARTTQTARAPDRVGSKESSGEQSEGSTAHQLEPGPRELKDLLNGGKSEASGSGERFSGLSPKAIRAMLPAKLREKLDTAVEGNSRARHLQTGLYELDSQAAADLIRARRALESAPGTPKDLEAIYHHLEDPSVKLTTDQSQILKSHIRPILEKSARIHSKLTAGGDHIENYVPRIPVGKNSLIDRVLGQESDLNAGTGLSKSASSTKSRTMMAIEDGAGNRRVVSIKNGKVVAIDHGKSETLGVLKGSGTQGLKSMGTALRNETASLRNELAKLETEHQTLTATSSREAAAFRRIANNETRQAEIRDSLQDAYRSDSGQLYSERDLNGKVFVDRDGKQWKLGQATTKEIEASTNVRYHKNALATSVVNFLQLRRAERAYDFLENYKKSADFQEAAHKVGDGAAPSGWRTTDLPQFHGYAFEPHTAEVLDWYAHRLKSEGPGLYTRINEFLRNSIFFNPLIHVPNIGVHWTVEKGMTGFAPQNWGRILRTGSRAINAVIHQNQDFLDALDAGAPLQSARLANDATTKLFVQRMGRELESNPTAAGKVANALGYANPAKLVKGIYDFSGKVTWMSNDIAMLQAAYDHMERTGNNFRTAMADVAKHIPDYRLPTRVLNSPKLAKLMASPNVFMFSPYHYGALRSYGEMLKGIVADVSPTERTKSLDRLAMLGLFTFVAYPALDQLAKKLTGDKTAQFRRAGASTFIDNIVQLARGGKQPMDVTQSIFTPAPLTKTLFETAINRDLRTGRHVYDWSAPAGTIGKQLARNVGHVIAPLDQLEQVSENRRTAGQQIAGLFGIRTKVPTLAETIARRYASDAAGDSAQDPDTVQEFFLRRKYEDALRSGQMTTKELAEARRAGDITSADQLQILKRASRTPLQNSFRSLTPEQALRVWDAATAEERQQIRPLLAAKIETLSKAPTAQRAEIKRRIVDALHPAAVRGNSGSLSRFIGPP